MAEQETRNGLIVTGRRQRDLEQRRELDGRHPARDQIRAVVALHGRRFRRSLLGVKAADDRFQDVGAGHHALEHAVFVMNQPHMDRGVAQDRDDVPRIEEFGNDRRRADQLADIGRLSRQIAVEHVLGVDDAERGIGRLIEHHEAGMAAGGQRRPDGFRVSARLIMLTSRRGVMTAPTGRSPRRMTPAIISFSPGSSTPAFSASTTRVRISSSLTFSSASPRWPSSHNNPLPDRSSSHTGGQRDRRKQRHVGRHPHRHRFRVAQGDLLGHQFANDERGVGDDRDHDADADRHRPGLATIRPRPAGWSAAGRAWRRKTRRTARRSA